METNYFEYLGFYDKNGKEVCESDTGIFGYCKTHKLENCECTDIEIKKGYVQPLWPGAYDKLKGQTLKRLEIIGTLGDGTLND